MKSISYEDEQETAQAVEEALGAAAANLPILPIVIPSSGLYEWKRLVPIPIPIPVPVPNGPIPPIGPGPNPTLEPGAEPEAVSSLGFPFQREELRLDVDGRYPLRMASGTIYFGNATRAQWIANLQRIAPNTFRGTIWYKDGQLASIPYTQVTIRVIRTFAPQSATVTFSGGGAPNLVRQFKHKSQYFHEAEFEFDCAQGSVAVTSIQTHAHPNRPANLPNETLTIEKVYRRAGFNVKTSGANIVPLNLSGSNNRWSDNEMHDAMQVYWSKFKNAPQWAMWVFFAALHERGTNLGGIMFDDIGPNHRQGTAIFLDSFISNPPAGDPNPAAWVQRMQFWTAVHEMGHGFNLAHSWDKSAGVPWIPLTVNLEDRSFMNYPYFVQGGQTAFFADFAFRFTDQELLFMRHAPPRFVQMGNADWFDHHGFEQADTSPEPKCLLEVRVNRPKAVFEFLEPVVLELKLTNISNDPQLIEERSLSGANDLTVIIKRKGAPARELVPYARHCWESKLQVLNPGKAIYESLFVSAGQNGWDIAEPGQYTIQVALRLGEEDIVSVPLQLRVMPPKNYEEEYWAQDFFTEDVGRVLALDGTRYLTAANNTLKEVAGRLANRKVAIHALTALGVANSKDYKLLDLRHADQNEPISAAAAGGKIKLSPTITREAGTELTKALIDDKDAAAETLGHIDYRYYVELFAEYLARQDASKEALKVQDSLHQTLQSRKVIEDVLDAVAARRDSYKAKR